jgi:hypothetical protein
LGRISSSPWKTAFPDKDCALSAEEAERTVAAFPGLPRDRGPGIESRQQNGERQPIFPGLPAISDLHFSDRPSSFYRTRRLSVDYVTWSALIGAFSGLLIGGLYIVYARFGKKQ